MPLAAVRRGLLVLLRILNCQGLEVGGAIAVAIYRHPAPIRGSGAGLLFDRS